VTGPVPDFAELRRQRNEARRRLIAELKAKLGISPDDACEPGCACCGDDACYCACPDGPCEHTWDGPDWESEDGGTCSVTCSRCGGTAISHDMRVMP